MTTFYLKFEDETQANSVLRGSDGTAKYASFNVINTVGENAPAGYHVSVETMPGDDEAALLPFSIVTLVAESES